MMRRIKLSGTNNTRDLGGYQVPGGVTAWGRTFRSDAPVELTAEDLEILRAFGIKTGIDLRTLDETGRRPSSLDGADWIDHHHVDLCARMGMLPDSEADVSRSYFRMTQQTEAMARIFRVIANAEGGVLFYCTAGKDRTGVVAAILLMLAGASREEVLADYLLTGAYLREPVKKILVTDPAIPAYILSPKIEYMEGFLDLFEKAYSNARSYLSALGLSKEEINSITKRLRLLT